MEKQTLNPADRESLLQSLCNVLPDGILPLLVKIFSGKNDAMAKGATDVWPLLNAISGFEKDELVRTLSSLGGSHDFCAPATEGDGDGPCIIAYGDGGGPFSGCVRSVMVNGCGSAVITVRDEDGNIFDISPEDVYAGPLSAITDRLLKTQ